MTAKKTTILFAVAMLLLEASWGQAQTETVLFKLESVAGVSNNPPQRTFFRLDQAAFITKIFTYHWNNGRGATPGRIALRNAATGQLVGNWNVIGTHHMFDTTPGAAWPSRGDGPPFLYWTVRPNVSVAAGTYEVLDSDPSSWAYNAEMGNRGCAWVFGSYGGGGSGQVGPSPVATPEVQPGPGIPVPGVRVTGMRFFEGPYDHSQPKPERVYLEAFDRSSARTIRWELDLAYPHPSQRINFAVDAVWYRPDGSEMGRQTLNAYVLPEWTSSNHTNGRGWADPGHWTPGTYRVDLSIQNAPITSGKFQIVGGGGGIGPSPAATPQVQPSTPGAQSEVVLFKLESVAGVSNNPPQKTFFRLDQPAFITKIFTYHWNNGRGATPGRIGLRNAATGQMVGMWNVIGTYHMFNTTPGAAWPSRGDGPPFLYWTVQPNVNVPAGTYEVLDSDPGTWAYNAEMRNMGCAWVFGTYGGGGLPQVGPSPVATPEVNPQPPFGAINIAGTWTSSDDSFGSLAVSQSGSNVNMQYPKRKGRVIGQLRGNVFDGYWIQDFSGRHCSHPQYNSSFWGRMILTFNGDSYTGNWGYCDEAPGTGLHGNRAGGGYGQVVPSPAATPEIRPAAQQGIMSVRITPAQQTINSGDKAVTTADLTGGTPPYSYAWYNGTKQSQVIKGGVTWTMRGAGTRDIKVVVSDSAGNTAEAHAQIVVR
ncbi:MAG: SprB repeat-containing protein [Terriglobia bacterium]|jgi:hypothetical protein